MFKIRHKATIKNGAIVPSDIRRFKEDLAQYEGREVEICVSKWVRRRTLRQSNSIHLYCQLLAQEFLARGIEMRDIIRDEVPIEFTPEGVKTYLWKPIQEALFGKKSTTELATD